MSGMRVFKMWIILVQIACTVTAVMSLLLIKKKRPSGWVWGIVSNVAYDTLFIMTQSYYMIPLQLFYLWIYITGYLEWKKEGVKNVKN